MCGPTRSCSCSGPAGLLCLLAALVLAACAEIDPVPTPGGGSHETVGGTGPDTGGELGNDSLGPTVERGLLVVSASRTTAGGLSPSGEGLVLVAGLPGAVSEGATRAVVRNVGTTAAADVPVNPDGSFAAVVPASALDQLSVLGKRQAPNVDLTGDAVVLAVPRYDPNSSPAAPAEAFGPAGDQVAITVTLTGPQEAEVIGSPFALPPGTEVVVADVALSTVVVSASEADGSFVARLEARPGDPLVLFTRRAGSRAGDPGSSSDAIALEVPLQ